VSTVSQTIAAPLKHSRLTTFFRYILFIPLAIVNWLYAIAAYIAVIIAWFAIVFTARYPAALYDFVAGYLRFSARALAYLMLTGMSIRRSTAARRPIIRCRSTSPSARSATAA
jgi:hypothetical protein